MRFKLEVVNGVSKVVDADTGETLDWVDTVDFVIAPGASPILYLGTFSFSADISAGRAAVAPGAPLVPVVAPPPSTP